MTTRLIIARHGNTFEDGETPRRVGIGTDMPLTDKGWTQARAIGRWLRDRDYKPDAIFCSHLIRTRATATIAMIESGSALHVQEDAIFNEVDYGPDENKTDAEVIARIGAQAIKDWDEKAIVPKGWAIDPYDIIRNWMDFGTRILKDYNGCTILVVTSNGIARFAPYLTGDFDTFRKNHEIKISTGALCIMEANADRWTVKDWNIKP